MSSSHISSSSAADVGAGCGVTVGTKHLTTVFELVYEISGLPNPRPKPMASRTLFLRNQVILYPFSYSMCNIRYPILHAIGIPQLAALAAAGGGEEGGPKRIKEAYEKDY